MKLCFIRYSHLISNSQVNAKGAATSTTVGDMGDTEETGDAAKVVGEESKPVQPATFFLAPQRGHARYDT